MHLPNTLQEAVVYFADPENCHRFLVTIRWPNGVTCPHCGSAKVRYMAQHRRWKCYEKHPRAQFSLKVGTIFEDSHVPLDKWLVAIWLVVNAKNGISSHELGRALGVTQKTAWFLAHRIRKALDEGSFDRKLGGEVEVDETFIGGKSRFMHHDRRERHRDAKGRFNNKTIVLGFLERNGEARAFVVDTRRKHALQAEVRGQVEPDAKVYTDDLQSYDGLDRRYIHETVNHTFQYVDGDAHTNTLEGMWNLLKRGLKGTYVAVSPQHLQRYVDELLYRYNQRKGTDGERFLQAMAGVVSRRISYKQLNARTGRGGPRHRLAVP